MENKVVLKLKKKDSELITKLIEILKTSQLRHNKK